MRNPYSAAANSNRGAYRCAAERNSDSYAYGYRDYLTSSHRCADGCADCGPVHETSGRARGDYDSRYSSSRR